MPPLPPSKGPDIVTESSMDRLNPTASAAAAITPAGLRINIKNPSKYKTQLCNNYMLAGTCRYGARCQFKHGVNDHGDYVKLALKQSKLQAEAETKFEAEAEAEAEIMVQAILVEEATVVEVVEAIEVVEASATEVEQEVSDDGVHLLPRDLFQPFQLFPFLSQTEDGVALLPGGLV